MPARPTLENTAVSAMPTANVAFTPELNAMMTPANRIGVDNRGHIVWGNGVVSLVFAIDDDHPVRMIGMSGRGMRKADGNIAQLDPQPIVELRSSLDSGGDNHLQFAQSAAGMKLRFVDAFAVKPSDPSDPDARYRLCIVQQDKLAQGPRVTSVFEAYPNTSAVRTYTMLHCSHHYPVEAVSSMNATMPLTAAHLEDRETMIMWGENAWDLENAWHEEPLRATSLRDRNQRVNPGVSAARFARSSSSTWSTGEFTPTGIIEGLRDGGQTAPFSFMWQIEHNGAWHWEIGENDPGLRVTAFGPEYTDHQWFTTFDTTHDCVTVPVSFVICAGDWQCAVAEMTVQRRQSRIYHANELNRADQFDAMELNVVYNDYLNTLNGDPHIEQELPLVESASQLGVDVFCIDAGWYDDTDKGWWNAVGDWEPAVDRFREIRLAGLIHDIQSHHMIAGLCLEPEVVGVQSQFARSLPDSAFFCRHSARVADCGRYHLDFRSPIARAYATRTIERLIDEYGVHYFKFDYNTTPGVGSDLDTDSVGNALLDHCRAVQQWIDDLRQTHPDIMIENSASGGLRADYAMLNRLDMQSTSNQADPVIEAAIAAGAGLSIVPEQQGNWACAQEDMSDEEAVFALASGVLGRLYLSGFINRMNPARLALVQDAIALHRCILEEQGHLVPWWPDHLPDFNGPWLAYGLRHDHTIAQAMWPDVAQLMESKEHVEYVTVWRRSGVDTMYLQLGEGAHITQVFPDPAHPEHAPAAPAWEIERVDPETVRLTVAHNEVPSARVFAVTYTYPHE